MYKLTVKCKGAYATIGEFIGWHQLEQLVHFQASEPVWEWFDSLIKSMHLFELTNQHLVTVTANGATVVYSIEEV